MQLDNYLEYIKKTVESYSIKTKKYLIKQFIENGIAIKETNTLNKQIYLDDTNSIIILDKDNNLSEQFSECIHKNKCAINFLEKWEFIKDYKYSVIFYCNDFKSILDKVKNMPIIEDDYENNHIYDCFTSPIKFNKDDYYFLKFNLAYSAIHPLTQEELLIKYPFIVVFHEKGELIEFRFDVLKKVFLSDKKEQTIYSDLINEMIDYLKTNYNCNLKPLNLDFMINTCKNDKKVKLIAQYMRLPSGGHAQLEVGNNQKYILPFIGELKSLINENKSDLQKVPKFRESMEQFMFEMEEMSDYPWIELLWENDIKTRNIHTKFIFNYMNNSYCLIQHYYSNVLIGMERMNYVIEYIINNRKNSQSEFE